MEHLSHLSETIGPRPTGSPANQAAADYVRAVLEGCDLSVERQEFPFPSWEHRNTSLRLGGAPLDAEANSFSPSCDVTGVPVILATVGELEAADLTGRVAVLHGDLAREQFATKGAIYVPERDRAIITLLEQKAPAALITVSPDLAPVHSLIQDWAFPLPSATVPADAGLALLRRRGEQIHLRIDTRTTPGHASNIIATRPGDRNGRIVVCAHYDTYPKTPGVWDNGSGVAVLLTLTELLRGRDIPIGLEWVVFNGEELGGVGDLEYLRRCRGTLDGIIAAINIDGVGQELGTTSIATFAASAAFTAHVSALVREGYPGVVEVAPWPASDHYTFYSNGVPSIALTSSGQANVLHRPTDTIEWMSAARLSEVVALTADLIGSLQDKEPLWGRTIGQELEG
jgi:aminopeptidase YwaD